MGTEYTRNEVKTVADLAATVLWDKSNNYSVPSTLKDIWQQGGRMKFNFFLF